jgi:hypothetical protein
MKLLAVILFALLALVLAHPMAAAAVLAAELGVCAAIGWMVRRAFCRNPGLHWRSA